jgi:hypothetical protein
MSSDLDLRKFFDFDENDLVANRKGQVTRKQKRLLKRSMIPGNIISIILGFAILAWGIYFPGRRILSDLIRFGYNEGLLINGATFLLVLGAFAFVFLRGLFTKKSFSVKTVEGKVSFASNKVTKSQEEMRVGNEIFYVGEGLPNIINEGDVYAFYYTADTRHILSCEFVSKGK